MATMPLFKSSKQRYLNLIPHLGPHHRCCVVGHHRIKKHMKLHWWLSMAAQNKKARHDLGHFKSLERPEVSCRKSFPTLPTPSSLFTILEFFVRSKWQAILPPVSLMTYRQILIIPNAPEPIPCPPKITILTQENEVFLFLSKVGEVTRWTTCPQPTKEEDGVQWIYTTLFKF